MVTFIAVIATVMKVRGIAAIFWIVTGLSLLIPHQMKSMRSLQIAMQEKLSPAQWIPYIRDLRRYEMDLGVFQLSKFDDVEHDVLSAMKRSGFIVNTRKRDNVLKRGAKPDYRINGYYFTPNGWLDAVYLDVTIDKKQGICNIYGLGTSTGFLPVAVPFSPFLSAFFCWVPFDDKGMNEKHLKDIRDALESRR